ARVSGSINLLNDSARRFERALHPSGPPGCVFAREVNTSFRLCKYLDEADQVGTLLLVELQKQRVAIDHRGRTLAEFAPLLHLRQFFLLFGFAVEVGDEAPA